MVPQQPLVGTAADTGDIAHTNNNHLSYDETGKRDKENSLDQLNEIGADQERLASTLHHSNDTTRANDDYNTDAAEDDQQQDISSALEQQPEVAAEVTHTQLNRPTGTDTAAPTTSAPAATSTSTTTATPTTATTSTTSTTTSTSTSTTTSTTTMAPTREVRVFSSFSGGVQSLRHQQPATLRSQQLLEAEARARNRASRTATTSFRLSPTSGLVNHMVSNSNRHSFGQSPDDSISRRLDDNTHLNLQSESVAAPLRQSADVAANSSPRDFQHYLSDKKQDIEQQVITSSESSLVPSIVSFIIPTATTTTDRPDNKTVKTKLVGATTLNVSVGIDKQQLILKDE